MSYNKIILFVMMLPLFTASIAVGGLQTAYAGDPTNGCQSDAECSGGDACNIAICNLDTGQCELDDAPNGSQCGPDDTCFAFLCDSGQCVEFTDLFDGNQCGGQIDECNLEVCEAGECVPDPFPLDGAPCGDSGECFEFLCNVGQCEESTEQFEFNVCGGGGECFEEFCFAGECMENSDLFDGNQCGGQIDECNLEVCEAGECVPDPFPLDGAPCGDSDICFTNFCDLGQCELETDQFDGDSCGPGDDCNEDVCDSGQCVFDPEPLEGQDCDEGAGMCTEGACIPKIEVVKTWTHTDYNWDQICDIALGVPGVVIGDVCYDVEDAGTRIDIGFRDANINNDEDDVLADPLPFDDQDDVDKFTAFAQLHKNKFSNTNPGAFYALTTVVISSSLSSVTVWEQYEDCFEEQGLIKFVSKKDTRNVKIAVADPAGNITELSDDIYDGIGGEITDIDDESAHIEITDESHLTEGSTLYVLVKFQDDLRGASAPGNEFDAMCDNSEWVDAFVGLELVSSVHANAALRITEDSDDDGVLNNADNCPFDSNDTQTDSDGDGSGNVCDLCLGDDTAGDEDEDGLCEDGTDPCPDDAGNFCVD